MDNRRNMRAGYQGKTDAMREKADKLLNHPGHIPDVIYSKSAEDKNKSWVRPYKKGGHVQKVEGYEMMEHHKKDDSKKEKSKCRTKFAMGGVAKIRHDEATADGQPKGYKKKPVKQLY